MSNPKGVNVPGISTPLSRSAALAALAAVSLGLLGAAIYLPADNQFEQRLGIVAMIAAVVVPALVASARGDKAATVGENTKADTARLVNGELHAKMLDVVHQALTEHDVTVHGIAPGTLPTATEPPAVHARRFHPARPPDTGH